MAKGAGASGKRNINISCASSLGVSLNKQAPPDDGFSYVKLVGYVKAGQGLFSVLHGAFDGGMNCVCVKEEVPMRSSRKQCGLVALCS